MDVALGKNKLIPVYFSPLVGQIRIDIRLWKTAVSRGYKMNPDGANLSLIRFCSRPRTGPSRRRDNEAKLMTKLAPEWVTSELATQ